MARYRLNEAAVFDHTIFTDLVERIGLTKMQALHAIFVRTLNEAFAELRNAAPDERSACLHQVTHMLVSTAGSLGFVALSAKSRAIMEDREAGDFATLVADLRRSADVALAAWDSRAMALSRNAA